MQTNVDDVDLRFLPSWFPKCPWPIDVFPATVQQYIELIPNEKDRTAISGLLMRIGWEDLAREVIAALGPLAFSESLIHAVDSQDVDSVSPPKAESGGGAVTSKDEREWEIVFHGDSIGHTLQRGDQHLAVIDTKLTYQNAAKLRDVHNATLASGTKESANATEGDLK